MRMENPTERDNALVEKLIANVTPGDTSQADKLLRLEYTEGLQYSRVEEALKILFANDAITEKQAGKLVKDVQSEALAISGGSERFSGLSVTQAKAIAAGLMGIAVEASRIVHSLHERGQARNELETTTLPRRTA